MNLVNLSRTPSKKSAARAGRALRRRMPQKRGEKGRKYRRDRNGDYRKLAGSKQRQAAEGIKFALIVAADSSPGSPENPQERKRAGRPPRLKRLLCRAVSASDRIASGKETKRVGYWP